MPQGPAGRAAPWRARKLATQHHANPACRSTAPSAAGKGLYRVHQFSKVELFVLSTPEQSEALHQELIDFEAQLFADLGLHYKVGDPAALAGA
jgi:seryl-tRNA synthetase